MMQRNSIDRLSGGTLFSLVVQAMRQRTNSPGDTDRESRRCHRRNMHENIVGYYV